MRLNLFIFILAISLILAATVHMERYKEPDRQKNAPVPAAHYSALPEFSFTALDGRVYETQAFRGKIIVLNFWASWCLPCLAEFPKLLETAESDQDGLVLIALSSDEKKEAVRRFLKKLGPEKLDLANVIIAHDSDKSITQDLFQTMKLPETIIVNPAGQMTGKLVGAEWTKEDMQTIIAQAQQDSL